MKELIIKKCLSCGAIVKAISDCNCPDCGIKCCDSAMKVLVPNENDAAFEKHVPVYEVNGDKVKIEVKHVMEDEHYIEWIAMIANDKEFVKYFKPGDECKVEFEYIPGAKLYSYCNKHDLWMSVVE